jgi:hypothetical protein
MLGVGAGYVPGAERLGFKREFVTITDAAGNQKKVEVPHDVRAMLPLANYFLLLAGAAAGKEWLLEQLFGIHPKTMRLAEIMAQFAKSNTEGLMAAAQKIWELNLQAGAMGSLGNYVQAGLVWAGQQDAKGARASSGLAELSPNLDPLLRFTGEIKKAWEQKDYTPQNFLEALNSSRLLGQEDRQWQAQQAASMKCGEQSYPMRRL